MGERSLVALDLKDWLMQVIRPLLVVVKDKLINT